MSDTTTVDVAEVTDGQQWRHRVIKALAAYDGPRLDAPGAVDTIKQLAAILAQSVGMIPDRYAGSPANVAAAVLQASRLNIPIMTALTDLYYDDGGMAMKASLIQMLVRRAGHAVIIHGQPDASSARVEIRRGDNQPGGVVEWTIGEATVAGLVLNETWQLYPADCLFARAVARAARRYAADATGGVAYVPEEIQSGYADGGEADVALADRVVSEPVATLLAGLDDADQAGVRDRWQTAVTRGLLNAYAGDGPGGMALTVGGVLRVALEATMPKPRRASPTSGAPTGLGGCSGGCSADEVIDLGNHRPGCDRHVPEVDPPPVHTAPVMAARALAATPKKTTKGKRGKRGRRRGRR